VEELKADFEASEIQLEQSEEALRKLKASEKQMISGKKVPRDTLRWLKNFVTTKKQRGKKYDVDSARQAEFAANLALNRKMSKELERQIPRLRKITNTLFTNYEYESKSYKDWYDNNYLKAIDNHNAMILLAQDAEESLKGPGPQTAEGRYKNANLRLVVT
jgi:hypothetical protein